MCDDDTGVSVASVVPPVCGDEGAVRVLTPLDLLQPRVRVAALAAWPWPFHDAAAERDVVLGAFARATSALAVRYPWLAGRVAPDGREIRFPAGSEPARAIPLSWARAEGTLVDAGLSGARAWAAPLVHPAGLVPSVAGEVPEDAVLALKGTLFDDGVVIALSVHHRALDGSSIFTLLAELAALVRSAGAAGDDAAATALPEPADDATAQLVALAAADHNHDDDDPAEDTRHAGSAEAYWSPPAAPQGPAVPPAAAFTLPPVSLVAVRFPGDALERAASAAACDGSTRPRVSTNDLVCALLWRALTAAAPAPAPAAAAGGGAADEPRLLVAVDARARLDPALPTHFLGNAAFLVRASVPRAALDAGTPLGALCDALHAPIVRNSSPAAIAALLRWSRALGPRAGLLLPTLRLATADLLVSNCRFRHADTCAAPFALRAETPSTDIEGSPAADGSPSYIGFARDAGAGRFPGIAVLQRAPPPDSAHGVVAVVACVPQQEDALRRDAGLRALGAEIVSEASDELGTPASSSVPIHPIPASQVAI